ncbi:MULTISPECIES: cbb3-type cytochrome oxidase assembly protein CcoS [unclassified Campylobacter]|uniref:cbb3-type cytochrome oxidase assembly protein CcoS n=1 Tax=unclassified Campylobacter TaxID=2593542 RepID=UPI00147633DC|nr:MULTISPECIES: cbb3-type cytochrome oxidase assembly protein CcoS [unclassified Campylobacter]QKG29875.1 cytochrome oxidase maturation protein, cbb3-type [Campylobacter sp. RM16187]
MDISIIALMIGISTLLGAFGLFALLWGLKTKQFEDYRKFLDGTKYDDEESLNDAYKMELKQKEAAKKSYRPPD